MKTRIFVAVMLMLACTLPFAFSAKAQQPTPGSDAPQRPKGPCDIYAGAGDPCVAAHSTTRALYSGYNGPLYQVMRQSDGRTLDIGVVQPKASPSPDPGGYANATEQDKFCADTYCWITTIYDQSPKHNNLTQAPRGGFSGPALGGFNNIPLADMAPVTVMGHKVYGVFIEPGMGLRNDDPKGTAVDDQAEGQYWVINGLHFNNGCCFDYGNAETDSRDDDNGTMETAYYGNATPWFHGSGSGPWIMTDQENNLVGCVNSDHSKGCPNLPTITWRFVTAMAKGEPHHWTSMGGNAQEGPLSVMFDGPRVDPTYDPMRKQGAILLGNGGDNSNGSQGTFYEGAMTAAGTFPSDATDQLVQANVVAAHYGVEMLSVTPASTKGKSTGVQTFSPGSSQETTVTFTNTTATLASEVKLSLSAPPQWTTIVSGATGTSKAFSEPVAPGASVSATFKLTPGPKTFNGDLVANASWTDSASSQTRTETAVEKIRNVSPVKINEFRIASGAANPTDSFIELYNSGSNDVDISNWTLTERPSQQPISSAISIPSGTKLKAGGFYLLGLSNSGLAVPARAGEKVIFLRNTTGMSVGSTLTIDAGSGAETAKIAKLGSAAGTHTTVWQPLPDGPIITIPAGSTNIPVASVSGFKVGEKIALGYGATYPAVARDIEKYEVATVSAVGKPGTQAYLAADARAGATNIKVTSTENISAGDQIRLDIDSVDHGIETVAVAHVGTQAVRTNLAANAEAGATSIKVRNLSRFAVGDKITIGTPANHQTVTISAIGKAGPAGSGITFTPALEKAHADAEGVVATGTGLDIVAPLKFNHADNMPFSDRGTGITIESATRFAHASNEPVEPLGTGVTLSSPLAKDHDIDTPVLDKTVTNAGYQGSPVPNQWFGGPELSATYLLFGRMITLREGSIVLRDSAGLVVDSLNYGGLVDPWATKGYQGTSGTGATGCHAPVPAGPGGFGLSAGVTNTSVGRIQDGADSDSNCDDFVTQAAATLSAPSAAGASNIKVASVEGFQTGQSIMIDAGADRETAVIANVGTAGATTIGTASQAGATMLPVAGVSGFREGEAVTIGRGADSETAVIAGVRRFGGTALVVTAPLQHAHGAGTEVAGSGITLTAPLARNHSVGAQVTDNLPTPGAPNRYSAKRN